MRILFILLIFLIIFSPSFAANTSIIPAVIVTPSHSLTHAPKTVITRKDLATTGATSLSEALQELGGVQLQDDRKMGSQVLLSIRGFGANASSNTLLLINGIPITNPDIAPPDLNSIPLSEIELIEITSGSESVLYGDQAVGGTINIVTRKQKKEKVAISCAAGSYNQHNCYADISNYTKKFGFGLHAQNYHSNNYRDHNNYDQENLSGRFNYPYQTGNIALSYQIANENMQYPGALTAKEVEQTRRQSNNTIDFFKNWNGFLHFQNQQQLGSDWRIETDVVRRDMHGSGVLALPFTQLRTIYFAKPQIKGILGKALLTSGIDVQDDDYRLQTYLA